MADGVSKLELINSFVHELLINSFLKCIRKWINNEISPKVETLVLYTYVWWLSVTLLNLLAAHLHLQKMG